VHIGDLVKIKNSTDAIHLILDVTKHKKTWHRKIVLYNTKTMNRILIEWENRQLLELINERQDR
jgi:hypothetical protein